MFKSLVINFKQIAYKIIFMHVYIRLRTKYTLAEEILVCSKKLTLALLPTTFNAMAILFCIAFLWLLGGGGVQIAY